MTGHLFGATWGGVRSYCLYTCSKEWYYPTEQSATQKKMKNVTLTTHLTRQLRGDVNVAASTNLGFGGHNACLIFKKFMED